MTTDSKRIKRTDHEWITLLTQRQVGESVGAFSKRIGVGYTQVYNVSRRYPEVRNLPAYAGLPEAKPSKGPTGRRAKGVRVLKPKKVKPPKEPGAKRRGRPPGSKNGVRKGKPGRPPKVVPVDPARNAFPAIAASDAQAMFYQDLSIALKSGRRLRIDIQLLPEGQ